jgi:hypothetical protein
MLFIKKYFSSCHGWVQSPDHQQVQKTDTSKDRAVLRLHHGQ